MTTDSDPSTTAGSLNPSSLSIADAAKLLSRVGGETVTAAMLEQDRQAGSPTNPDGTIHLVHYAAWLAQQLGEADGH